MSPSPRPPARKAKTSAKHKMAPKKKKVEERHRRSVGQHKGRYERLSWQYDVSLMCLNCLFSMLGIWFPLEWIAEVVYNFIRPEVAEPEYELDEATKEVFSWVFSPNDLDWNVLEQNFLAKYPHYRPGSGGGPAPTLSKRWGLVLLAKRKAPHLTSDHRDEIERHLTSLENLIMDSYMMERLKGLGRREARAHIIGMISQRSCEDRGLADFGELFQGQLD